VPLKKLLLKPGVNKENTRYASENGWYECDKIRFRQGTPERIGGWNRISGSTFLGLCRHLWNWVTLSSLNLMGLGTNLKYYIEQGGVYYDITPIRSTVVLTNPFTATLGSSVITVADTAHGCVNGDFVTFSGAVGLGGNITAGVLNKEHQITLVDSNTYTITVSATANATDAAGSPGGGASVVTAYQLSVGPEIQFPLVGWGAGGWGSGSWGVGATSTSALRLWSAMDFGEDLIFGPRGGGMYYWDASAGTAVRGVNLNSLGGTVTITIAAPAVITLSTPLSTGMPVKLATTGALPTGLTAGTTYYLENVQGLTANLSATSGGAPITTTGSQSGVHSVSVLEAVPTVQNVIFVSDTSRFVFAFGCNDYFSAVQNPMLIRWSDQESAVNWYPQATNQAGSLTLSHGSEIIAVQQTRQEILVWTDTSLYSLQYLGPPVVWGSQLLGDNISIQGQNAVAVASGVVYWMGVDKFYVYDGSVKTLNCDLRRYVFNDFNNSQNQQVFAGTNEGFNEVWWFYCSKNSTVVDKYVVYNYLENIWYYGTLSRTAWIDSGLRKTPAAATYSHNLVNHEEGVDDNETGTPAPITAYIESAEFDIEDGHQFGFVWRILPDVTFDGSTAAAPSAKMTLIPMNNSGSGFTSPRSSGGTDNARVTRTATIPIEAYSGDTAFERNVTPGQVYVRVRGRQMILRMESDSLGTMWQLGAPRLDVRLDGRR
jgi:hypothetical protein